MLEANLAGFLESAPALPHDALTSRESLQDWLFKTGCDLMRRADEGDPAAREQSRRFEKLRRDLKSPYDDQAVGAHIQRLDRDFELLKAGLGPYPRRFLAFGSAVTGGFGAHSDLDFFFSDAAERKTPVSQGGAVGYGRGPEPFQALWNETAQDLRPLTSVRELILGQLAERGVRLTPGPEGWTATRLPCSGDPTAA